MEPQTTAQEAENQVPSFAPDDPTDGTAQEAEKPVPSFAPDDPTDGRDLLDWKTKYPDEVRQLVRKEAIYLISLLGLCPILLLFLWLGHQQGWSTLKAAQSRTLWVYGSAWIAGTLGGTLFDLKWLYHSTARQLWHQDRRSWRLLTPHISGGLSFVMVALVSSGLLRMFDKAALQTGSALVGFSFVIGYFSDSAIGKLSELADTLLGSSRRHRTRTPQESQPSNKSN